MQDLVSCGLNCTANDVQLSLYNVIGTCDGGSQNGAACIVNKPADPCVTGGGTCVSDVISCVEGEILTLNLQAELVATAAERYDIGLYVALDGGDALTGTCLEQYLPPPLKPALCNAACSITTSRSCLKDADCPIGETCVGGYNPTSGTGEFYDGECDEDPNDTCGDLEQGVTTLYNLPPITLTCQDADGNGFLDLGTCTSWEQGKSDGGNKPSCTVIRDTLPGSPSKCNCEAVQVGDIVFRKSATIEVVKVVLDTSGNPAPADPGRFNLQIDSTDEATNVGDGGTTGAVLVSAGTNTEPGDTHTVGETFVPGTDSGDYEKSISCNNAAANSCTNCTSLSVDVDPDEVIVCTVTNKLIDPCLDVVCDDSNACTTDTCVDGGCVYTNVAAGGGACDDGDACTSYDGTPGGADACDGNGGCLGRPVTCPDDGNACTTESCDAATGACGSANVPAGSGACDDGDACTSYDGTPGGADACDGNGECLGTDVLSTINVLKLTEFEVNPLKSWTFAIYAGPNAGLGSDFLGTPIATDTTAGDPDGVLDFGGIEMDPDNTYTLCERNVPAGWSSFWLVDTTGNGDPDTTVIPYNPNWSDPVPQDLGNRCVDIGFGTAFALPCGEILNFEVNNTFPGGDPRTPGYWKNWNSCTSGNQTQTAAKNGGPDDGWYILDDILNNPGIVWGDFVILTCEDGVSILDQRDLNTGRKNASDAAYTLAMHLMAAQLNFAAGAETCSEAWDAAAAGEALLVSIGFDGTGKYLRPRDAEYALAVELAATLDLYNNGILCGF